MLHKVRLIGKLGQTFGREHQFDISSPAEAIRALCANFESFRPYLLESESQGVGYSIYTLTQDRTLGTMDETQLQLSLEELETVIIAPVIAGSGGGFGKILLGGALLAGSFFMPGSTALFGAKLLTISSTSVGLIGASMIFGGISQLISPTNKTPKDKKQSYLFDQAAQTGSQGQPVPVLYGTRIITGMVVLSSSVTTVDIS